MVTLLRGHGQRPAQGARWPSLFVVLVLSLSFLVPGAAHAQEGGSVTVGTSTVTFTGDWEIHDSTSIGLVLEHRVEPGAVFSYIEIPSRLASPRDNAALIELVLADQGDLQVIDLWGDGTLADGTLWQLYSVTVYGGQAIFVVTGNTGGVPGAGVVTSLLLDPAHPFTGHAAANQDIKVNGEPHAIAGIDSEAIGEILWEVSLGNPPATAEAGSSPASATPEPDVVSRVPAPGESLLHWYFNDETEELIGTAIENFVSEEEAVRAYDEAVGDFAVDEAGATIRRYPQNGADLKAWGPQVDEGFLAIGMVEGTRSTVFAVFRIDTVVYVMFVPLANVAVWEASEFFYYELRGEGSDHLPEGFYWGMTT